MDSVVGKQKALPHPATLGLHTRSCLFTADVVEGIGFASN